MTILKTRAMLAGIAWLIGMAAAQAVVAPASAAGASATGYLATVHEHHLLASTVPENGDQNPYAMVVAPVTAGSVRRGDLLVDNFNNRANLQGMGTTIVDYRPATGQTTTFATIPGDLAGCPGGVGLSTAMVMLKSGWVIVGSAPSTDGTTRTLGPGCLIILGSNGAVAGTIAGPKINDPWGNMAWIDNGDTATLFLSNAGFDIGTSGAPTVRNHATVLRIGLTIPAGKTPAATSETVIADGFSSQADASVFLIGPTGLTLGKNGTLYVSDAIGNRVVAIADAAARMDSAGTGRVVSAGGLLNRPLAMDMAPNGDLLVVNGLNGQVVEIDPATARQLGAQWIDTDEAQTPPGSGDLFGLVVNPAGKGFYYVEDDMNTVVQAQ